MAAMRVAELWRYPVKSLGGERLDRADVSANGIAGDRIVHVRNGRGRVVTTGTPWTTLEEKVLEDVFGQRMLVTPSPDDGSPLVVPVRGA